jgi:hypothetical protein
MNIVDSQNTLLRLLTVKLIMTPKDRFVTCKDDDSITDLGEKLKKYDFLPVLSASVQYFVSKTDVERLSKQNRCVKVREVKQRISENQLISGEEPIYRYLLQRTCPLFVTGQNEVVGIVTPADLNKTPSKMLFYILISYFELLLIKSIKDLNLTDNEMVECIGYNRWQQAIGRHERATRENYQLSPIDCLDTRDLINLACKKPSIRKRLNYQSESEARENLGQLVYLRNKVMHAGHFIIQNEKQLNERRVEYERIRKHIADLTSDTATLVDLLYIKPLA